MRTTRKVLLALVLTLCVAAVLSVCAFAAYDLDLDLPAGAVKGDDKWVDSGYGDIDADGSGWVMIGGAVDYSGTTESWPTIAKADAGRFYWNKTTDKGVYVMTGTNLNANWEDWNPISTANPTAADQKKLYAFSSAFVDEMFGYYGKGAYQSALGGDVPATTEKAVYVDGSKIGKAGNYVVYERWVSAGKASKQWTNFTVTKASYDSFVAKRAELEAAGTTGTDLEDALVEFVYTNFAGYKIARNVKENGAFVMLTWVWKQLQDAGYVFDTVEVRSPITGTYVSTFGLALRVLETKTLLFEDTFVRFAFSDVDRGFLHSMANLTTFAQVKFDTSGDCIGTYEEGVIDLRGFNTVTSYKDPAQYVSYILKDSSSLKKVIWFESLKSGDVEVAGIIDQNALYGCAGLETLTIPSTVILTEIRGNAFNGCTALKVINVEGAVSADMTIVNKNAFTGVSGLTINVSSNRNKIYMEKALENAGVTGVTVVNVAPPSELDNAIVADGYSIRQNDENAKTKGPALRAEFTLKSSVVDNAEQTLVDFGVVVFSADTYKNVYGSDIYAVYDAAVAGTDTRVIRKSAKNGPYVAVHDNGDITFAAAITKIPEGNYQSAIYTYAYAVWSDGTVGYTTYTSERTGKTAHSLYDMTIFALRNGLINSENTDSDKLWPVLEKGALAYEGNIGTSQAADPNNYTNATLYLNNPLYAYSNFVGNDQSATGVTLEATSSTNVMWSIYADGDEYVVVYRNAGGEGEALLPGVYREDKSASHPFNPNYIRSDAHTPALSKSAYEKIKALVIDYGIDGVMINGDGALACMSYVETIVYPNGFDEIDHYKRDWGADKNDNDGDGNTTEYVVDVDGDGNLYDGSENYVVKYLFSYNKALKDIIWANHDQYAHMQDFNIADGDAAMKHLFDLRGMKEWPANQNIFTGTPCVQNVVFGAGSKRPIYDNVFRDATALERAWHETSTSIGTTYDAPLAKTIDLGVKVAWGNLQNSPFGIKSNGYVVILFSGNAANPSYAEKTFFDVRQDVSTLTVRVKIVDANGAPADPTKFMAKINSAIADRVFVYQITGDNAGKYVNASGTVYSE